MDAKIENYADVNTINALTSTLLSIYIRIDPTDGGFTAGVQQRKREIIRGFFIEGKL